MAPLVETTWALEWRAMRSNRLGRSLPASGSISVPAGGLWLSACLALVLVLLPAAAQTQQAESPAEAVGDLSDTTASETQTSQDESGLNVEDSVTNNGSENSETEIKPIDSVDTARPSLDYEPTETISEDSSVSFPVDI